MYKALVCCRAGMGSSMLLKIKADQVINENNFPIKTEHGNLDSIVGFTGDLVNRPDYFGFVLGSVADHNNVLDGVRFIPKNDINGGAVVNTDFLGFVPQIGNNQCATGFI